MSVGIIRTIAKHCDEAKRTIALSSNTLEERETICDLVLTDSSLMFIFVKIDGVFVFRVVQLARDYASRRSAFGKILKDHALHVQTLARMEARLSTKHHSGWHKVSSSLVPHLSWIANPQVETRAAFLLVMDVCRLLGREESGVATQLDTNLLRLLTPVLKLYTGKQVNSYKCVICWLKCVKFITKNNNNWNPTWQSDFPKKDKVASLLDKRIENANHALFNHSYAKQIYTRMPTKCPCFHKAVAVVSEGLESFGGQGYIEDTGLPGLLRDAQVRLHYNSIWGNRSPKMLLFLFCIL